MLLLFCFNRVCVKSCQEICLRFQAIVKMSYRAIDDAFVLFDQDICWKQDESLNEQKHSTGLDDAVVVFDQKTSWKKEDTNIHQKQSMGLEPQIGKRLVNNTFIETPNFSCPYRKHDPKLYNIVNWRRCVMISYTSIARVEYAILLPVSQDLFSLNHLQGTYLYASSDLSMFQVSEYVQDSR